MLNKDKNILSQTGSLRSERGGFTALAFIALIPLLVALLAFGVDFKHHQTAQQQLQKATDAAALAGAEMLWCDGTIQGTTYVPDANHSIVTNAALSVAQLNVAEGQSVSNNTPGVTVKVEVTDPVLPKMPPPVAVLPPALQNLGILQIPSIINIQALLTPMAPGTAGTVQVTATMQVRNLFGVIFGHGTDTITAFSKAGSAGPAYSVNAGQLFPIAISWLSVPSISLLGVNATGASPAGGGSGINALAGKAMVDVPLVLKRVGDPIVINVSPTLDQNAGFTNFKPNPAGALNISHAIDQYLGIVPLETGADGNQKDVIPALAIGERINLLSDNAASNKLVSQKSMTGKVLYMPVVLIQLPLGLVSGLVPGLGGLLGTVNSAVSSLLGLNQVIGFVAVKVDQVIPSANGVVTIRGIIVNGQRFGSNKESSPGLLASLLNTVLSLVGVSGGNLLSISNGQAFPLTATQTVKLLQ